MSFLLSALGLGKGKSVFRNTEEQIFLALLQSWGFKLVRRMGKNFDFEKQVWKESKPMDKSINVYTMSGGPMVVFEKKTGKFVEWA